LQHYIHVGSLFVVELGAHLGSSLRDWFLPTKKGGPLGFGARFGKNVGHPFAFGGSPSVYLSLSAESYFGKLYSNTMGRVGDTANSPTRSETYSEEKERLHSQTFCPVIPQYAK
jgi:hypothetical protein